MSSDPVCDVLVVGAGAAGGAVAWRLARGGASVVCLEQGGWVDRAGLPHFGLGWEVARTRSHHPDPNVRRLPEDYPLNVEQTEGWRPLMYNAVGGSTVHWGAHIPRLHPSDFRVRTLDGVADDWPLDYWELEPYYDLNDRMTGIAGLLGDPANPPRAARQTPPLPLGRGGERVAGALDRLGWHWWPADAGINSTPYGAGRGACNNCGPCDLGCPTGARASTDVTYWPEAIRHGATLRTGARAAEVTVDARGRATGVVYLDRDGNARRQRARAVVLACNGVGTPRLLLLSRSPAHPDGLANSSGLVGRNLMHHPTAMATAVFDERVEGYKGPFAVSLVCQEFYETQPERDFVRGLNLQLVRSDGPLGTALGGHLLRVPWGDGHHEAFLAQFARTASFAITAEDLPNEANAVDLDPELVDSSGLPAPRVRYRVGENELRILAFGRERAREILEEAGARSVLDQPLMRTAASHLLGTARMGEDPARSVVDRYGRAHDCQNLFVADGSLFPTAGALNPTATIQALALRLADHVLATSRDLPEVA